MQLLPRSDSVNRKGGLDVTGKGVSQQAKSTRLICDYIKGVCILIISWHHLVFNNFPKEFSFLGHQFVVFFFIISGYGIYMSLDSDKESKKNLAWLLTYISKRVLRVYPLYWLWICVSYDWTKLTVSDFFLLSLNAPPVWFLNAIVYCYIAAPALYFVTSRTGRFSIVLYTGGVLFLTAALDYIGVPVVLGLAYCKVYFSYVFAFGCGMALARPGQLKMSRIVYHVAMLALGLLFLFCALQISMFSLPAFGIHKVRIGYYPVNPYVFPFFLSSILLMYFALNGNPVLPFSRAVALFGRYSLSIYLFHNYYVQTIVHVMGLNQPKICYFIVFVAFLPVLLASCWLIETLVGKVSQGIVSQLDCALRKNAILRT